MFSWSDRNVNVALSQSCYTFTDNQITCNNSNNSNSFWTNQLFQSIDSLNFQCLWFLCVSVAGCFSAASQMWWQLDYQYFFTLLLIFGILKIRLTNISLYEYVLVYTGAEFFKTNLKLTFFFFTASNITDFSLSLKSCNKYSVKPQA